jgi:uncharacterized membrane protein YcjF (UPF0283 family)
LLNQRAEKRVTECAKWVGVKTAISPYPIVDMGITCYWSLVLVRDLCQIYNVRPGKIGLLLLFIQVSATIFISGKMDKMEDHTISAFKSIAGSVLSNDFLKNFVGNAAGKAASGLVNYYLIRRIGRFLIAQLQPLRQK